jgi:hypothetical protein
MRERPIKIVEIDFALEGKLMMKIKELKGNCSPWINDSCRPQAESEELSCNVDILTVLTSTVINGDRMDTICMENSRIEGGEARGRAGSAIMA